MEALKAVGTVCALVVFAYLFISVQITAMVLLFSRMSSKRVVEDKKPDSAFLARYNTWAASHGFVLMGAYRALGVPTTAWFSRAEATRLVVYRMKGAAQIDLITELAGQNDVTTTSTKDSQLFPKRPGVWVQSFSGRDLDELWTLHGEAVAYVRDRLRLGLGQLPESFPEAIAGSTRKQMEYVRSLPYWPLRWPYWYFIRRRQVANKTVREQVESGLLP